MTNNLSNYLKGINYEKVGKYEEAFNIFQNDSSDFSLSKLVIYQYLGLGTDKNYKNSLENLKKIKSQPERKFLASYFLLNEDKKNSIDYLTSLEGLADKKNGNANEILGDLYLKGIFVEKNYKKSWKNYYISSFRINKRKQIPNDEAEKFLPTKEQIYQSAYKEMYDMIQKDISKLTRIK